MAFLNKKFKNYCQFNKLHPYTMFSNAIFKGKQTCAQKRRDFKLYNIIDLEDTDILGVLLQ